MDTWGVAAEGNTAKTRACVLDACPMFAMLSASELAHLADIAEMRAYEAGEHLFRQEHPAQGFHIVATGRVRVHRLSVDRREQILHVFGPGEVCGEVPVFQGTTYPASAAATEATRTLYLPGDTFRRLARRNPDILLEMLAALSVRLRQFVNLIDDLSLKEVSARVAKHLLDEAAHTGRLTFTLGTTKALFAARVGTVPETLSRMLKKMQKRQIIDVAGRSITIRDRDTLVELAAGMRL